MRTLDRKRRRDLRLRKWLFGATALTIFLGTMAFAASYDAYRNLDASYRSIYKRLALADVTVTGADASFESDARRIESVAAVTRRVQADVPLRVHGRHTFLGRLVGLPASGRPRLNQVDVLEGTGLSPDRPAEALVETHVFDYYELDLGETVEYFDGSAWRELVVAGSVVSPEYIWPVRSAQDVMSMPDSFGVLFVAEDVLATLPPLVVEDQYLVGYRRNIDVERTDEAVREAGHRADAAAVVVKADQPSNETLQTDVLGFQQMAYAFPALFLVAAAMATYTLMTRLVLQERELIGTLRANGLSRRSVVGHYLGYGLWLGGAAGLLGVVVGVPLGWLMTEAYTSELGIPEAIRDFRWSTVLVGLLFGLGTGLVSAWLPARHAARLEPAEAMRGEMAAVVGRRSIVERMLPFLNRLPASQRMVLRGIARNRRRSLSTILGVVLALVLLMASWGLMDSMGYLLTRQFEDIQHDDASIVFTGPVDDAATDRVARTEGVQDAERVYALSVSLKEGRDAYATQLLAFAPRTRMHDFEPALPDDGVLLGSQLRDGLGLEVDDNVTLVLTTLDTAVDVRVAGFVNEPLGTFAYMQREALLDALARADPPISEEDLSGSDTAAVLARFAPRADRQSVIDELRRIDGVAAVRDTRTIVELMEDYMGLFYLFIGIMLVLGGLLAFALLFTTMSANMAERSAELAIMRANGYSRRQVARLVVWENVLLTLIAIPIGLIAGHWAADAMLASYATDMWSFDVHFAPLTYVWCAAAMIVVTLASLWPSLRAADRMDIGSIVRQRSM